MIVDILQKHTISDFRHGVQSTRGNLCLLNHCPFYCLLRLKLPPQPPVPLGCTGIGATSSFRRTYLRVRATALRGMYESMMELSTPTQVSDTVLSILSTFKDHDLHCGSSIPLQLQNH